LSAAYRDSRLPLRPAVRSARSASLSYAAAICSISRLASGNVMVSARARVSSARWRQKSASYDCVTSSPGRPLCPRSVSQRQNHRSVPSAGSPGGRHTLGPSRPRGQNRANFVPDPETTDAKSCGSRARFACVRFDEHTKVAAFWNLGMAAAVHLLMKRSLINDPAYWRERAAEARRIAEQLADAVAKQTMLEIARSYDNLAELTEKHPASERST
jgi:hypothetical protein